VPNPAHPSSGARRHRRVGGALAPAAAFLNTVAISALLALAGSARLRIRIKTATNGGELKLEFVRPGSAGDFVEADLYTANNPAPVAVVAGTETMLEVADHFGEAMALLTFTPTGNGTITYCDISEV